MVVVRSVALSSVNFVVNLTQALQPGLTCTRLSAHAVYTFERCVDNINLDIDRGSYPHAHALAHAHALGTLCQSFYRPLQAFGAAMGIDNKIISAAAQHFFFCYLEFGLAKKKTSSAGGYFMFHIVPIKAVKKLEFQ